MTTLFLKESEANVFKSSYEASVVITLSPKKEATLLQKSDETDVGITRSFKKPAATVLKYYFGIITVCFRLSEAALGRKQFICSY